MKPIETIKDKVQIKKLESDLIHMDKETGLKLLDKFTDFKDVCISVLSDYKDLCDKAMSESYKETLTAYKTAIDILKSHIEQTGDNLSDEQIIDYKNQIIDIAHDMERVEQIQHEQRMEIVKDFGTKALGAATILGTVIAAFANIKISTNDNDSHID